MRGLLIFLFLITSSAFGKSHDLQLSLCEAAFDENWAASPSLRLTEGEKLHSRKRFNPHELWRYTGRGREFQVFARKILSYRYGARAQEILLFEHFSKAEQTLILDILRLSEEGVGADPAWHPNQPNAGRWREVGAFVLIAKDGRAFLSAMTSNLPRFIDGNDLLSHLDESLQRVQGATGLQYEDLAQIQMFHTHSGSPVLSSGDDYFFKWMRTEVQNRGFRGILHTYAVKRRSNGIVGSHKSVLVSD